jgi:HAD superfamily hydrolase (TIGR01509 family)
MDDVARCLAEYRQSDFETARDNMAQAITYQEEIPATKALIADLKAAGYRLFVLSNMSKEYIEFLRKLPVFECFDAQVISSEVGFGKPDRRFYEHLLTHCELNPAETIFIDDRKDNVEAAAKLGIVPFHFALNDPEGSCEELRKVIYNE